MQDNDAVITARHMPPCALAVMCSSYPVDGIEPSSRYILVGSSADSWVPVQVHLVQTSPCLPARFELACRDQGAVASGHLQAPRLCTMQAQTRELSKELYVCTLYSRANRNGSRGCNGRSAGPRLGPLPWVSGEEQLAATAAEISGWIRRFVARMQPSALSEFSLHHLWIACRLSAPRRSRQSRFGYDQVLCVGKPGHGALSRDAQGHAFDHGDTRCSPGRGD